MGPLATLALPVVYVAFLWAVAPVDSAFQFDFDEGVNLAKASLFADGFPLYTEIWSDQPPLFTALLAGWLSVFGETIGAARLLVLLFAGALLGGFAWLLRRSASPGLALAAVAVLMLSRNFAHLSVAVLIGLPAVCLATLSLCPAYAIRDRPRGWALLLSGALFGLALQVKLFVAFLVPLVAGQVAVFDLSRGRGPGLAMRHAGVWLLGCGISFAIVAALFYADTWEQLVAPHAPSRLREVLPDWDGARRVPRMLGHHPALLLLAGVGAVSIFRGRRLDFLLPVGWLLAASAILFLHAPVWFHQGLLLTVPLVWLATFGAATALGGCRGASLRALSARGRVAAATLAICGVILAGSLFQSVARTAELFGRADAPCDREILASIRAHRAGTRWIYADRPIFAWYAGLRVPPEVAVPSWKRAGSGGLSTEMLLGVLASRRPEQLQLGRLDYDPAFRAHVEAHYTLARRCGATEHWWGSSAGPGAGEGAAPKLPRSARVFW